MYTCMETAWKFEISYVFHFEMTNNQQIVTVDIYLNEF